MKKLLSTILASIMLVSAIPIPTVKAETTNILQNGDFEQTTSGNSMPTSWRNYYGNKEDRIIETTNDGINNSTCIKLTNTSSKLNMALQTLTGLEPYATYRVTGYIKGVDIEQGAYNNGAHLQAGVAYQVDSTANNWQTGTFDWIKASVYFVAKSNGTASIECRLTNPGVAYFDNITVEKINYPDTMTDKQRLDGKNVTLYLKSSDIEQVSSNGLNRWINELDTAYLYYEYLVGGKPFGGDKIFISATDEPYVKKFGALGAINPIKWNQTHVLDALKKSTDEGYISFGMFHEIGHDFDTLSNWTFDGEATANFKMLYVLDNINGIVPTIKGDISSKEMRSYFKTISDGSYENTIVLRNNKYSYDAFTYLLARVADTVGWDTIKATFRQFNNENITLTTALGKFNYFLKSVQQNYNELNSDAVGNEVYNTFPDDELDYIKNLLTAKKDNDNYVLSEDVFLVTFKDYNGNILKVESVNGGDTATAPENPYRSGYTFSGWDKDFSNINANTTVTATYTEGSSLELDSFIVYPSDGKLSCGGSVSMETTAKNYGPSGYYTKFLCYRNGSLYSQYDYSYAHKVSIQLSLPGTYSVYAKIKEPYSDKEITTNVKNITVSNTTTIYYKGYSNPNIHYQIDGDSWTSVPGLSMSTQNEFSGYTHKYTIDLKNSSFANVCFNDGNGNWDSNNGANYQFNAGVYTYENGVITQLDETDLKITNFELDVADHEISVDTNINAIVNIENYIATEDLNCSITLKKNGAVYKTFSSSRINTTVSEEGVYEIHAKVTQNDTVLYTNPLSFVVTNDNNSNQLTIFYKGYNEPYIHYQVGSGNWTTVPGYKMLTSNYLSQYPFYYTIDLGTDTSANVCFNDGNGNWDSRYGNNYQFESGYYTYQNGNIKKFTPLS